ncbi:Mevalonate kinase [Geodia barretti]|uniref:mevalonate kinase n=1 Tax=Geodia barretti TaxID=519541 RepID=A0AA35ST94_GEOBA|nr:Mevalonate kinase [Geodia barretti]
MKPRVAYAEVSWVHVDLPSVYSACCATSSTSEMASSVVVSAPGKVILHGEHAVVYGKAALATSVDLRCYVVLKQVEDATITLDLPDFDHHVQWSLLTISSLHTLQTATEMTELKELAGVTSESPATQNTATLVFLYLLTHICREKLAEFPGLSATVISTLPASAGLGSSAAFSVSLAAGFLSLIGEVSPNQRLNKPLQQQATVESERGSAKVGLPMSVMQRLDKLGIGVSGSVCTGWSASEMEVINEWGLKAEKLIHGTPLWD